MKNYNNKKIKISVVLITLSCSLLCVNKYLKADNSLADKIQGRILLQVEQNGEAWYLNPGDQKRYYLGRPDDAFALMKDLGIGITNTDLEKIPISLDLLSGKDSDGDGLPDAFEDAIGTDKYNPDTDGDGYDDKTEILHGFDPRKDGGVKLPIDLNFAEKQKGKILLQVENNGEAWYVNPADGKRYFLGRPSDAFNVMRGLGLGISNEDLKKIPEFKINFAYLPENIKNNHTEIENQNSNFRKYKDPEFQYSISFPSNWKITKDEKQKNITQITDSVFDFISEKRGVISISYFSTQEEFDDIALFRIGEKGGKSKMLEDEERNINGKKAYVNSYEYEIAFGINTIIQKNPEEFIQIDLATSKSNFNYYKNIYEEIIESLDF